MICLLPLDVIAHVILLMENAADAFSLLVALSLGRPHGMIQDPDLQARWLLKWRSDSALHLSASRGLGNVVRKLLQVRPNAVNAMVSPSLCIHTAHH